MALWYRDFSVDTEYLVRILEYQRGVEFHWVSWDLNADHEITVCIGIPVRILAFHCRSRIVQDRFQWEWLNGNPEIQV